MDKRRAVAEENARLAEETGLSVAKVEEFREFFSLVDEDQGGSIDADELMRLTELMNMGASKEEVDILLRQINQSEADTEVTFDNFVRSLAKTPKVSYTQEEVKKAFRVLAGRRAPEDGWINILALEDALTKFGDRITTQQAQELTASAEVNSAGALNYEEYVNLVMSTQEEETPADHIGALASSLTGRGSFQAARPPG